MSNNNNNLPLTHADGTINGDNPKVCAAMVDAMGVLLTRAMNDIGSNPEIFDSLPAETRADLLTVHKTMQALRNAIGRDADWYTEDLHPLIGEIYAESKWKREAYTATVIDAMLKAGVPIDMIPPEMRPKPSAADAADALLDSLRADGVIG
jgi:hypothetical protein